MTTLTKTRISTTKRTAGLELPECWRSATAATEARLLQVPASERTEGQRRALRRVSSQARRLP